MKKNNFISKFLSFIIIISIMCSVTALPASATTDVTVTVPKDYVNQCVSSGYSFNLGIYFIDHSYGIELGRSSDYNKTVNSDLVIPVTVNKSFPVSVDTYYVSVQLKDSSGNYCEFIADMEYCNNGETSFSMTDCRPITATYNLETDPNSSVEFCGFEFTKPVRTEEVLPGILKMEVMSKSITCPVLYNDTWRDSHDTLSDQDFSNNYINGDGAIIGKDSDNLKYFFNTIDYVNDNSVFSTDTNITYANGTNKISNITRTYRLSEMRTVKGTRLIDGKTDTSYAPYPYFYQSNKNYSSSISDDGMFFSCAVPAGVYNCDIKNAGEYVVVKKPDTVDTTSGDVSGLVCELVSAGSASITINAPDNNTKDQIIAGLYYDATGTGNSYVNIYNGYMFAGTPYTFKKKINKPGKYKVELSQVRINNININAEPDYITFDVTQADLLTTKTFTLPDITYQIKYNDVQHALSGDGNYTFKSKPGISKGGSVNVTAKYYNRSDKTINAQFSVNLPAGVTMSPSVLPNQTIGPMQSGSFVFSLTANTLESFNDIVSIPLIVSHDGYTYTYTNVSLEKNKIDINAPAYVGLNKSFKVFGNVNFGDKVDIYDADTHTLIGTSSDEIKGRYSVEINGFSTLGTHNIYAQVQGTSDISKTIAVETSNTAPSLSSFHIGTRMISPNNQLGIATFQTWLQNDLKGTPFTAHTKFTGDITSVVYHFACNDYPATEVDGSWSALIKDWSTSGEQKLSVTVNDSYTFDIALLVVLIDPSGIVTDAETGLPVEGAVMTCEESTDEGGSWNIWSAAQMYAQENPMLSDTDGKYGWDTTAGLFRVTATKDGYNNYDTTSDDSIEPIRVLPPRTDVDIKLEPSVRLEDFTIDETARIQPEQATSLTANIVPSNATNADKITWESENESIATVDETGKITGVAEGKTKITATFPKANGENIVKTCTVTVKTVEPTYEYSGVVTDAETGLAIASAEMTCQTSQNAGDTWEDLVIEEEPVPAKLTDDLGTYSWNIPEGLYNFKVVKNGYVEYNTKDDTSIGNITLPPANTNSNIVLEPSVRVEDIVIDEETNISLKTGEKSALTASVTPANATNANKIVWDTTNEQVVKVDNDGNITAVAAGTADVTITFTPVEGQAIVKTYNITVSDPITQTNVTFEKNEKAITGTIHFKDNMTPEYKNIQLFVAYKDNEGILKNVDIPQINTATNTFDFTAAESGTTAYVYLWDNNMNPYMPKQPVEID